MAGTSQQPDAEESRAGGTTVPPGWPHWLAAAEDALVRAVVAGLVALVVVQSLIAGRGQLAYETYGRVLEDWGYVPTTGTLGLGPGEPQAPAPGAPAAGSAAPGGAAPPGDAGQPSPAAGLTSSPGTPAGRVQAVVTLEGRGPGTAVLLLNGTEVGRLSAGQVRPFLIHPGDRLVLRSEGAAPAAVVVTHVAGPVHDPRPATLWQAGAQGTQVTVTWRED